MGEEFCEAPQNTCLFYLARHLLRPEYNAKFYSQG